MPRQSHRLLIYVVIGSRWVLLGRLTMFAFIKNHPGPSSPLKVLDLSFSLSALQFGLAATHTVWECMVRCFSKDVFLLPVAHRFTRLLLQVCVNTYNCCNDTKVLVRG